MIGCWSVINQTAVSPSLLRTWLKLQNVILLVLIPPRPPSRDCCSAQGNEKCCKNSELLSEWGNNLEEKLHVKIQLLEKCTHCISLKYFVMLMSDFSNFPADTGFFILAFKDSIRWPQFTLFILFLAIISSEAHSSSLLFFLTSSCTWILN